MANWAKKSSSGVRRPENAVSVGLQKDGAKTLLRSRDGKDTRIYFSLSYLITLNEQFLYTYFRGFRKRLQLFQNYNEILGAVSEIPREVCYVRVFGHVKPLVAEFLPEQSSVPQVLIIRTNNSKNQY